MTSGGLKVVTRMEQLNKKLSEEGWGESWKDRKRRWAETYPAEREDIEDRALDEAQPPGPPDQIERWLKDFSDYVKQLKHIRTIRTHSPAKKRELLLRAATLLTAATKVLDKLGRYYIPRPTRDAVAAEAQKLRRRAKRVYVLKSGGSPDPDHLVKVFAAEYAFDLLNDYQRRATQTTEGRYFTLASILFEAATGRVGVSIDRQCREYIAELRMQPNASGQRKRTSP